MNKKRDTLFDGNFTFLDFVKICLLIVTAFSTWNVVDIMTPNSSWAWVRKLAAVLVVEGAFIGFELATSGAKNKRQVNFATIGFFFSLAVISLFAGLSGLLEFGGADLIGQHAGDWLGLTWLVGDAIKAGALLVLVAWIAILATIYRLYSLNDPDKKAELFDIQQDETMRTEEAKAREIALTQARPTVASHRALAKIKESYTDEIGKEQMEVLLQNVASDLRKQYAVTPPPTPQSAQVDHTVAVDPQKGFVARAPNYEQQFDAMKAFNETPLSKADRWIEELKGNQQPYRSTPIYFTSAISTKGDGVTLEAGTPLQAILCEDGKYNISEQDALYAFARVTAEELGILQGDAIKEEKPTSGTDFREAQA